MNDSARKRQDKSTALIFQKLKERFRTLPDDPDEVVYRYNPAAIRIRVVDPSFAGKSFDQREADVLPILNSLPKRIATDISVLLLLTPEEAHDSSRVMNLEFENPALSRL